MGSPGGALLGGLGSTMASLEVGSWMVWPGNSSPGLNQSAWGVGATDANANASATPAPPGGIKGKNLPALLILVIIALTVGGNILVILAVSLEKKLQNATNFFLRSLAVADMLVGILVMPMSLVNILYDYAWPLPSDLCPIWIYLDVLFSTASIMHLCTISLDRYVAIKNPIEHSRFNSRTKARVKILAVWTISIGISMPIPVIGLHNKDKVFVDGKCVLNEKHFMLIGSFVAFFIPLVIMVVTYCLTIQVLQRQATVFLCEAKTSSSSQQPLHPPPSSSALALQAPPPPHAFLIPQINVPATPLVDKRSLSLPSVVSRKSSLSCLRGAGPVGALAPPPPDSISIIPSSEAPPSQLSSPAGRDPTGCHGRRGMMQAIKNERRASKVLGIVFFLFLVMWCPFFITNVTAVVCRGFRGGCAGPLLDELLDVFVWVGYVSSGVNPLVYTLFNRTYRQAFSSYIRCRYRPSSSASTSNPASNAAGRASTAPPPSHTTTPVLSSIGGGAGGKAGGVDRNRNCRNGGGGGGGEAVGGGVAGGNGRVPVRRTELDDTTDDDETEQGGMPEEEEEEEEEEGERVALEAGPGGTPANGSSLYASECTSRV